MDNIAQLTDKELSEKRVQLAKIGEEITNKERQTDEDLTKMKDCRKQIENIDTEISKRESIVKEVNENKQFFTKAKKTLDIEQRGERYGIRGPHISQASGVEQEMRDFLQKITAKSKRIKPSRCAMLMPDQYGTGICSRGEHAVDGSSDEVKAILQTAAMFSQGKGTEVESRADTFGFLADNGAVVPTIVSNEIVAQAMDITGLLNMCYVVYEAGEYKILKKDLTTDRIQVKKTGEREKLESHIYKYSDLYLKGDTIRSYAELTNTMIITTPFDAVGEAVRDMADTFSYQFERSLFHADEFEMTNANTFGFKGIETTVETQTNQGITFHDLLELTGAVQERYSKNAVFLMNRRTFLKLKQLENAIGEMPYLPDPQSGQNKYFFDGHLIIMVDAIDAFEPGHDIVYYGDLSGMAIKISDKLSIKTEEKLDYDTRGIHGVLRYDARVKEPFKFAKLKVKNE
jgi:HK97 family phage major capsid protein